MIITKAGVTLTESRPFIHASDGKVYSLNGNILSGPTGIIASRVRSWDEAVGCVAWLYGGKQF